VIGAGGNDPGVDETRTGVLGKAACNSRLGAITAEPFISVIPIPARMPRAFPCFFETHVGVIEMASIVQFLDVGQVRSQGFLSIHDSKDRVAFARASPDSIPGSPPADEVKKPWVGSGAFLNLASVLARLGRQFGVAFGVTKRNARCPSRERSPLGGGSG